MGRRMKRALTTLVAVVALLSTAGTASAATLGARINALVTSSSFTGTGTSISVWDDTARRWVYLRNGMVELKPASNMKLTTAVAVLGRMGAAARLQTRVFMTGTRSGSTLNGSLYLVGGGDPSFSAAEFSAKRFSSVSGMVGDLAAAVRATGITRVTGRVYGDESKFDSVRTAPFWRPEYWRDCPPITALSLNQGWVRFGSPYSYSNQALRAATVFRNHLLAHGVTVVGSAGTAWRPAGATQIATEYSPPVYRLVMQMNIPSDNFHAEVLNKDVAVARGLRGTTWNGRYVTRNYLTALGVNMTGSRLYDGSGLSYANRVSSRQLLGLLFASSRQPYAWWLKASLPLAGVTGTLRDRMTSGPAHANARAKTGTLRDASALSGYVATANGHRVIFSMIMNHGPYLNITAARSLQDRIVQTIAGSRPVS
jgi:D-alanyl-D-alanine carboxypeptidase/D-alanyl-D-alanine-endopeptidase (penicillin-binding protein 4)